MLLLIGFAICMYVCYKAKANENLTGPFENFLELYICMYINCVTTDIGISLHNKRSCKLGSEFKLGCNVSFKTKPMRKKFEKRSVHFYNY